MLTYLKTNPVFKITIALIIFSFLAWTVSVLVTFPFLKLHRIYITASDYQSFVTGGSILKDGMGEKLYDLSTQIKYQNDSTEGRGGIILPFRHLPVLAVFFLPFSYLSTETGYWVFYLLNLTVLIVALFVFKKTLEVRVTLLILLFLFFPPTIKSLLIGQTVILNLFFIVLSAYFLKQKDYFYSGLLFSVVIEKPTYIFLLPYFFLIADKKWPLIKGFLLGLVFQVLMTLFFVSPATYLAYPNLLALTESAEFGSDIFKMNSLTSLLVRLTSSISVSYLINTFAILFLFLYFFAKQKGVDFYSKLSAAILFFTASNFHSWAHNYLILLIPIVVLVSKMKNIKGKKLRIIFLLTIAVFYLINFPFFSQHSYLNPLALLAGGFLFLNYKKGEKQISRL